MVVVKQYLACSRPRVHSPVVEFSIEYLCHIECEGAAVAGEVHVALGHRPDRFKLVCNIQRPRDHRELAKGGAALCLVVCVNFGPTFKEGTFVGKNKRFRIPDQTSPLQSPF